MLLHSLGFLAAIVAFGLTVWIVAKIWVAIRRVARDAERSEFPEERTCIHCGYDLRASEGRCPECGTAVPTEGDRAAARCCKLDPIGLTTLNVVVASEDQGTAQAILDRFRIQPRGRRAREEAHD